MKSFNRHKKSKTGISLLLILLLLTSTAFAAGKDRQSNPIQPAEASHTIDKGEISNRDILLKAYTGFSNKGTMNGLMAAYIMDFQNSGTMTDNIMVLSHSFTSSGLMKKNLIAYASSFYLGGSTIEKDVFLFGGSVFMDEKTHIRGDVVIYANDAEIKGKIDGSVKVIASRVLLNASTDKDVTIGSPEIVLGKQARIAGNLTYQSDSNPVTTKEAVVKGKVQQKNLGYDLNRLQGDSQNILSSMIGTLEIAGAISLILLGVLLCLLFPTTCYKAELFTRRYFLRCVSVGSIAFLLITPLCFVLAVTFVGLPFALSLISIYLNVFYLATIPAALFLGGLFIRREGRLILKVLIGLALLEGLSYLAPSFFTAIIHLLFTFAGAGCILISLYTFLRNKSKREKMEYAVFLSAVDQAKGGDDQHE